MPSKTQTALIQRFHARCAALEQQAGRVQRNVAFIRAVDEYGMAGVLQACFDYVTSSHSQPTEWIAARDARYCLTPNGEGLRVAHQQTGAVVGDAYTAQDDGTADRTAKTLIELMTKAGCPLAEASTPS